jgi:hypothetical protein
VRPVVRKCRGMVPDPESRVLVDVSGCSACLPTSSWSIFRPAVRLRPEEKRDGELREPGEWLLAKRGCSVCQDRTALLHFPYQPLWGEGPRLLPSREGPVTGALHLNVDFPAKKATVHVAGCSYAPCSETEHKGVGVLRRDGGWFTFHSWADLEAFHRSKLSPLGVSAPRDCARCNRHE